MKEQRKLLKADLWTEFNTLQLDQQKGAPHPPIQKPYPEDAEFIHLISPDEFSLQTTPVLDAIRNRRSRRSYTGDPITLEELSYLLWATQGVRSIIRDGETSLRTVPSAGARHPFETYLFINYVDDVEAGLYRYLGVEHQLLPVQIDFELVDEVHQGTLGQYVQDSAVVFIWTAIPYRAEWRYGPLAHKMIAQDSGHMCQNLYLACESIGIGMCAIGAYNQKKLDEILGVDGTDEFTIYVATVGQINE